MIYVRQLELSIHQTQLRSTDLRMPLRSQLKAKRLRLLEIRFVEFLIRLNIPEKFKTIYEISCLLQIVYNSCRLTFLKFLF